MKQSELDVNQVRLTLLGLLSGHFIYIWGTRCLGYMLPVSRVYVIYVKPVSRQSEDKKVMKMKQ